MKLLNKYLTLGKHCIAIIIIAVIIIILLKECTENVVLLKHLEIYIDCRSSHKDLSEVLVFPFVKYSKNLICFFL